MNWSSPQDSPEYRPLGPLMIDIAGLELSDVDRKRLMHPLVGGLILFARNFQSPDQLQRLTKEVHSLRLPALPIAIDHEGGRVQRCRAGFTRLPPMRCLGELWERDSGEGLRAARAIGFVLAAELRQCGVDLSFTPVLDLDWGRSGVIGDRSFHRDPEVVSHLAGELIKGLREAGMAACGKHFPGHGWTEADSHVDMPVDDRDLSKMEADILPYRQLTLDAVMPAHVIYPAVDSRPAGFSPVWINKLRNELGFDGVIFSDDLSMEAAGAAGDVIDRVDAAWRAGCDMLLVCNAPTAVDAVLDNWHPTFNPVRSARVERLLPKTGLPDLIGNQDYLAGVAFAGRLLA